MTIGDKVSLLTDHSGSDATNDPLILAGSIGTITGKNPNYESLFYVTFDNGVIVAAAEELTPVAG